MKVKLTESQLRDIIREAVREALNETEDFGQTEEKRAVWPIPTWAIAYLINADPSGLEDEDIDMVDKWQRNTGIGYVCVPDDDDPYFTTSPAFGQPCDVFDCVCIYNY